MSLSAALVPTLAVDPAMIALAGQTGTIGGVMVEIFSYGLVATAAWAAFIAAVVTFMLLPLALVIDKRPAVVPTGTTAVI